MVESDTKDLFVQEYEINLSKSNELVTVQYFCNKAGEPIYFPDRTLATLFQVNLSTLRGRFNRLTKKHEGYRLLINEKSKARLSSLHFINWATTQYNTANQQQQQQQHPSSPDSAPSSPNSSPLSSSISGMNFNGNNSTSGSNNNNNNNNNQKDCGVSPLHGLVALNHINLVNVALSEWIAHNHERLGTSLKDIENNLIRANLSFTRNMDTIFILQKKFVPLNINSPSSSSSSPLLNSSNGNNNNNNNVEKKQSNYQQQKQQQQQYKSNNINHNNSFVSSYQMSPPSSPHTPDHHYNYSPFPITYNNNNNNNNDQPQPFTLAPFQQQQLVLPSISNRSSPNITPKSPPVLPIAFGLLQNSRDNLVPQYNGPISPSSSSQSSPTSSPSYRDVEEEIIRNLSASKKRMMRDDAIVYHNDYERSDIIGNNNHGFSLPISESKKQKFNNMFDLTNNNNNINNNINIKSNINNKLPINQFDSFFGFKLNSNISNQINNNINNSNIKVNNNNNNNNIENNTSNFVKCKLQNEESYKKIDISRFNSFTSFKESLSNLFGIYSFMMFYQDSVKGQQVDLNEKEVDWRLFSSCVKEVTLKPNICVTPDIKNLLC